MVQSLGSTWTLLIVVVVLGNARYADAEETLKEGNTKVSQFRTYLNSFSTVAPDSVSVELFGFPEQSVHPGCSLSPNGMFLTTSYHLQDVNPNSVCVVLNVKTRREVARFHRIQGNGTFLVPIGFRWSPDSSELYVAYEFADLRVGAFWFQWDLKECRFTTAADDELRKLKSMRKRDRPDWMSNHKAYDCGPMWTIMGKKFDHLSVIHHLVNYDADGNSNWNHPEFRGEARYFMQTKDSVAYNLFVEASHADRGDKVPKHRTHVFHDGKLIETYLSPIDVFPGRLLFEYRENDLLLYMDISENLDWKTNLGRVRVDHVYDLHGVKGRENGEVILKMTKDGRTSIRLIRLRAVRQPSQ